MSVKSDGMREAFGLVVLQGVVEQGSYSPLFFESYLQDTLAEGVGAHDGRDGEVLMSAMASVGVSALGILAKARRESSPVPAWEEIYPDFRAQASSTEQVVALDLISARALNLTGQMHIEEYLGHVADAANNHSVERVIAAMAAQTYGIFKAFESQGASPLKTVFERIGGALAEGKSSGANGDEGNIERWKNL